MCWRGHRAGPWSSCRAGLPAPYPLPALPGCGAASRGRSCLPRARLSISGPQGLMSPAQAPPRQGGAHVRAAASPSSLQMLCQTPHPSFHSPQPELRFVPLSPQLMSRCPHGLCPPLPELPWSPLQQQGPPSCFCSRYHWTLCEQRWGHRVEIKSQAQQWPWPWAQCGCGCLATAF